MTDIVREDLRLLHIRVYVGRITAVALMLISIMINVFDVDIVELFTYLAKTYVHV